MSKIALSPHASGTGVFTIQSPNSNTDRTLTLPDEAGTVLTSASDIIPNAVPTFSAYLSAGQSIPNATYTKIQYDTEEWDLGGIFDAANYKFLPTTAGYYQVNACVRIDTATGEAFLVLYKNGSYFRTFQDIQPSAQYGISGSTMVYANGSTDYFEVYFWHNKGSSITSSYGTGFPYQAFLVRAA